MCILHVEEQGRFLEKGSEGIDAKFTVHVCIIYDVTYGYSAG
jgi:hypothetical protein